ncbi:TPA: beta strand repeat-containing protein, partial [Citrobacter braakii]
TTNSATGTNINGNSNVINNKGHSEVSGEGSTGISVTGNDNTVNNDGDLYVFGGATGINMAGDGNTVNHTNGYLIDVTDKNSKGVIISGDNATFNNAGTIDVRNSATGVEITGKSAAVNLDGTINVIAETEDTLDGESRNANGNGYYGVKVASENTSAENATNVTIDGSINVIDNRSNPKADPKKVTGVPLGRDMTGLDVTGSWNNVAVTGAISVDVTPYLIWLMNDTKKYPGYRDTITALNVNGTNNTVVIENGINLASNTDLAEWPPSAPPYMTGIAVDGEGNEVTIKGESTITTNSGTVSSMSFAQVSGGSSLTLDSSSNLNIVSAILNPQTSGSGNGKGITVDGAGSQVINDGNIDANIQLGGEYTVVNLSNGATLENNGTTKLDTTIPNGNNFKAFFVDSGSSVINRGTFEAINNKAPSYGTTGISYAFSAIPGSHTGLYGIGVQGGSTGINSGEIITSGLVWAMAAGNSNSLIINEAGATITQSANYVAPKCPQNDDVCYANLGGGMSANEATAINYGTITINDSGLGMFATRAGVAINKGTINLEGDATAEGYNKLVGMVVVDNGIAYNDGTININAGYGKAFYNDGTGTIHNSGTVNLNESGASMGATPTDTASAPDTVQHVSGYVLGTHADGSAGTLNAGSSSLMLDSVSV